jgi:riboflavin biosynthesis pyrimidine reductase
MVITTGRYLREYAEGKGQENLKVYEQPEFADLAAWRRVNGLKPYPDIAVLSGGLDFPIPDVLKNSGRAIYVLTTQRADPQRKAALAGNVTEILTLGKDAVDGKELAAQLGERGYQTIFLSAGPKAFHLLLAAKVVDRLYLTWAHRILGGQPFASIVEGGLLSPATDLRLRSLYLDAQGLDGLGQVFAAYDVLDSSAKAA